MQPVRYALHSAGVEGSEDAGARSKLPQPSQEEEALMCLLKHCICVSRPAVVCVQGGQEWAEDAALWSTSVERQGR